MIVTQKNRGVPVDEWKKVNKNKCPLQEGHTVMPVMIVGKGLVDHVVESKGKYKNEVDIDYANEVGVHLTETIDDGSVTARAGQQQDRFDSLIADTLGQGFARASEALRVQDPTAAASATDSQENKDGW